LGTLHTLMSPPAAPTSPSAASQRLPRWLTTSLVGLLALVPVAVGLVAGYRWSERAGLSQLAAVANERLGLYAATLEAELARFAYLPSLIATQAEVQALLTDPANPQARAQASRALARVGVRAGANLVAVVANDQAVLATSQGPDARPAAADNGTSPPGITHALTDGASDFFAANESDGTTDYYFTHTVRHDGRPLGQIVVKVNLAPLEATWIDLGLRSQSERLLVVDDNEVVVMSSVPGWKYRTVGASTPARQATGRYAAASLAPLDLAVVQTIEPGVTMLRTPALPGAAPALFLAQERAIVPLAVRLVALSDPSSVWRQARSAAWGGAAGGAVVGLLALYLLHRRRALRQLFQARNALQQAHDQLERQVDERTVELRSTNDELKRQIAQRLQAEDELMQAGKLAVLGQMSAGISHEINQPLTALRALSSNAMRLLDVGRGKDVADNLRNIDAMAERMGRIVNQLKSFARKEGLLLHPVDLATAVHNVLLMLAHRLDAEPVAVVVDMAPALQVRGDTNRLEQVLLNLAGNALDAMAAQPGSVQRQLRIAAVPREGRTVVQVDDTGPGMDDAAMQHLFEPFFTTKPAGQGLGLGLMISAKIVREFGGTLRAHRTAHGMRFEFDLEAIEDAHV